MIWLLFFRTGNICCCFWGSHDVGLVCVISSLKLHHWLLTSCLLLPCSALLICPLIHSLCVCSVYLNRVTTPLTDSLTERDHVIPGTQPPEVSIWNKALLSWGLLTTKVYIHLSEISKYMCFWWSGAVQKSSWINNGSSFLVFSTII